MTTVLNSDPTRGEKARGLWLAQVGGQEIPQLTNIPSAETRIKRGSGLINVATGLLFALGIALYVVSIFAQWRYVMDVKHNDIVSWIEASSLDAGMSIFTLLALGLSRAGQTAKVERLMIVVCGLGSAAMNYEAANKADLRSALAYTVPPIFLAAVVDRTVSVIRRHYLGDEDASAWHNLGKVGLYLLRLIAAPISTLTGARRMVLAAAPVPGREREVIVKDAKPGKDVEPLLAQPVWRYALRAIIAPFSTVGMVRNAIKDGVATKLPAVEQHKAIAAPIIFQQGGPTRPMPKAKKSRKSQRTGPSKTAQFLDECANKHGALSSIPPEQVYAISKALAPQFDLHPGSARTALRKAILASQDGSGQ